MTAPDPFYVDDAVAVYNVEALDALRYLPTDSVDLILTDPPYSSGGMYRGDRARPTGAKYLVPSDPLYAGSGVTADDFEGDSRDQRSWAYWATLWLDAARRITVPGGIAAVFADWRQLASATDALQCGGWVYRGIVGWDKTVARPTPGRFTNVLEFIPWGTNGPRDTGDATPMPGMYRCPPPRTDRLHQTQKPVELLAAIIDVACPPGGTVLDPFTGSGTTMIAAEAEGFHAVGIELDAEGEYVPIIAGRCDYWREHPPGEVLERPKPAPAPDPDQGSLF